MKLVIFCLIEHLNINPNEFGEIVKSLDSLTESINEDHLWENFLSKKKSSSIEKTSNI